jgi:hypothetical protein
VLQKPDSASNRCIAARLARYVSLACNDSIYRTAFRLLETIILAGECLQLLITPGNENLNCSGSLPSTILFSMLNMVNAFVSQFENLYKPDHSVIFCTPASKSVAARSGATEQSFSVSQRPVPSQTCFSCNTAEPATHHERRLLPDKRKRTLG